MGEDFHVISMGVQFTENSCLLEVMWMLHISLYILLMTLSIFQMSSLERGAT